MEDPATTSVKVALRIRPQGPGELAEGAKVCTSVAPSEPQVFLGDKAFTFDHVFDRHALQPAIYETAVRPLLLGTFQGYNATVLAYGQTGSGKTFTMGTGFDLTQSPEAQGMVPRAVGELFAAMDEARAAAPAFPPDFRVSVQFIELYNEEVKDLLSPETFRPGAIRIHEDAAGGIYLNGVSKRPVASLQDTMGALRDGALGRTTAATGMNATSSRSHAIFTLEITQQRLASSASMEGSADSALSSSSGDASGSSAAPSTSAAAATATSAQPLQELETLTAKLHFVDLAGSERQKRTGATGERLKEGIAINSGLQFLGNVISALADQSKKSGHVPYRDSKLTRLLQDSLGGNSRTLMMACVSPSDTDFVETLSTLNYANRAKQIKNKVVVNQDRASAQLASLRTKVAQLETELAEVRQGKRLVSADSNAPDGLNDMYHENVLQRTELANLHIRVKALTKTVEELRTANASLRSRAEVARIEAGGGGLLPNGDGPALPDSASPLETAVHAYMQEIEELRSRLVESQQTSEVLRVQLNRAKNSASLPTAGLHSSQAPSAPQPHTNGNPEAGQANLKTIAREDIAMLKARQAKLRRKVRSKRASVQRDEEAGAEDGAAKEGTSDYASAGGPTTDEDSLPRRAEGRCKDEETAEEGGESSSEDGDASTLGPSEDWDEEDLDDDEEETSEEEAAETARFRQDLADLTEEISIKERLVSELEASERRLATLKQLYEAKIAELNRAVGETEKERDAMLAKIDRSKSQKAVAEETAKIRTDYEAKLGGLRSKLHQAQGIEREHSRLLRQQQADREKLGRLHGELADMRRAKAALSDRMRDEAKRQRDAERRRAKELAALERDARKKDAAIRQLKSKSAQQETILKRKNEELDRAKKKAQEKAASARAAQGRTNGPTSIRPTIATPVARPGVGRTQYSARRAKSKWLTLEKAMSRMIEARQASASAEADLEREMEQRQRVAVEITAAKDRLTAGFLRDEDRQETASELEALQEHQRYLQGRIQELQAQLTTVEDTEDGTEGEEKKAEALLAGLGSLEEAKYLLSRLFAASLANGLTARIKDRELRETGSYMACLQSRNEVNQQLLDYTIAANPEVFDLAGRPSLLASPPPLPPPHLSQCLSVSALVDSRKARRKTATPSDLLYPLQEEGRADKAGPELETMAEGEGSRTRPTSPTRLLEMMEVSEDGSLAASLSQRLESLGSEASEAEWTSADGSPRRATPRMGLGRQPSQPPSAARPLAPATEPLPRKFPKGPAPPDLMTSSLRAEPSPGGREPWRSAGVVAKERPGGAFSRGGPLRATMATTRSAASLPTVSSFPSVSRDMESQMSLNSEDEKKRSVFSRLQPISFRPKKAKVRAWGVRLEESATGDGALVRVGVVEGHEKAVLSVAASGGRLLSGSKDGMACLWDLETGRRVLALGAHSGNVTSVELAPRLGLALAVSDRWLSVYDTRSGDCVHSLNGLGGRVDGVAVGKSSPGPNLHALHLLPDDSDRLLVAGGNSVRIWDLRGLESVGELSKATMSPSSDVFALASFAPPDGQFHWVATGSRDRYVKLYKIRQGEVVGCVEPVTTLEPPHYDNVTALLALPSPPSHSPRQPLSPALRLVSASRDKHLMLWEGKGAAVGRLCMERSAHREPILCLARLGEGAEALVASSGRDGAVRLWGVEGGALVGRGKTAAHRAPVNALASDRRLLFSASDDGHIAIWRPNSNLL